MRALAKTATRALVALCLAFALVVAVVAAIGILDTPSATKQGKAIAGDQLTTAVVTGQLARSIDTAYTVGQEAVRAVPAERSRLLAALYDSRLPAADARLFALEQLHAADPPAEHADIELLGRQWTAVRNLLSPADLLGVPASSGSALAAAYAHVSAHLDRLFR